MNINAITPSQINPSNADKLFIKYNTGDIIRAQILEFTANTLLLSLSDGTTLNAYSETDIAPEIGKFLELEVTGNKNGLLYVKLNPNNFQSLQNSANSLKNTLIKLGIPLEKEYIEAGKALLKFNLPINKESIDSIIDMINNIKSLDADKAGYLYSIDSNISRAQPESLQSLLEGKNTAASIISSMTQLIDSIEDKSVLNNILKELNINFFLRQELKIFLLDKNYSAVSKNITSSIDLEKLTVFLRESISSGQNNIEKIWQLLNIKLSNNIDSGNENLRDIVEKMYNSITENVKNRVEQVRLQGETKEFSDIKNVIKDKYLREPLIKIDGNQRDGEKNNIYQQIKDNIQALKSGIIKSENYLSEKIIPVIDNMLSSLTLLNSLSNYGSYIQIPLHYNNNDTSGELYILKKSGKGKIDMDNITFLISLNTQYIGKINTLANIRYKNISLEFQVEKADILSFIKSSKEEIQERFKNISYRIMDIKFSLSEEKINVLNSIEVLSDFETAKIKSIDLRV